MRVDGVILLGIVNDDYIAKFAAEEIPLVLVDGLSAVPGARCISVDNAGAVNQVMDYLYGLGHRRIAYLDTLSYDVLRPAAARWVDSVGTRERRPGVPGGDGPVGSGGAQSHLPGRGGPHG